MQTLENSEGKKNLYLSKVIDSYLLDSQAAED